MTRWRYRASRAASVTEASELGHRGGGAVWTLIHNAHSRHCQRVISVVGQRASVTSTDAPNRVLDASVCRTGARKLHLAILTSPIWPIRSTGHVALAAYNDPRSMPASSKVHRFIFNLGGFKMDYFDAYGEELARQFTPTATIKRFADNSAVIGAFAEAIVMKFVRNYLAPIHVSTGTVISPEIFKRPGEVPQIDSMLWSPCPLPAIFEADGFALVPQMSCLGILEIKRSAYTDAAKKINNVLIQAEKLVRPLDSSEPEYPGYKSAIGVVCLLENDQDKYLNKMIEAQSVVVLSRRVKDQIEPMSEGIHVLMHYLGGIRARYQAIVGTTVVKKYGPVAFDAPMSRSTQEDIGQPSEDIGTLSTGSAYKITPRQKADSPRE